MRNVACTHPNANPSAFAPGRAVEMACLLREGAFRLARRKFEHASVVLVP